ncbi:MAG TPA: anti-sigma factor [Thermoleophilaceae bacterium]|nr:anti-sigma factor [Thermoleophilaceae bacterium]
MATFDQLSAEQRAIIELVLKQNQEYEQLGTMLGLPTSRVRELAREALVRLSPVSAAAVDDDWRGQLADYLLNQQTGPEATATKGHLRRSEAARGWARSVLDSLEQFYDSANIPTIPEGEPAAAPRRERKPKAERKPRQKKDKAAGAGRLASLDAIQRRRLMGGGALALVLLFAVLVWPVGALTGGGDDDKPAPKKAAKGDAKIIGQLVLRPVGNTNSKDAGVAVVAERGGQRQLIVQAQLTPSKNRQAYEVWLYNSQNDARSLGAQVTDQNGTFQGAGPLPANFERFKFIDVSVESVDQNRKHSGNSVLRGQLDQLQAPPANTQNGQQGQTAPQGTTPAPQGTTPGQ